MVTIDVPRVLDGVGDVRLMLVLGALSYCCGSAELGHIRRIGHPVVETDVCVYTGTADNLEVTDRFNLDINVTVDSVTVVIVGVILHEV